MREIILSTGVKAIVDDQDYPSASEFRWFPSTTKTGVTYALRMIRLPNGRRSTQSLHRMIAGVNKTEQEVAHINGNGLDCRRENMRVTTKSGNGRSIRVKKVGSTSRYRGVALQDEKWVARIGVPFGKGKTKSLYIGIFSDENEAAIAYNTKAIELGYFPEALNKVA